MKKFKIFVLSFALMFASIGLFSGCGTSNDNDQEKTEEQTATTTIMSINDLKNFLSSDEIETDIANYYLTYDNGEQVGEAHVIVATDETPLQFSGTSIVIDATTEGGEGIVGNCYVKNGIVYVSYDIDENGTTTTIKESAEYSSDSAKSDALNRAFGFAQEFSVCSVNIADRLENYANYTVITKEEKDGTITITAKTSDYPCSSNTIENQTIKIVFYNNAPIYVLWEMEYITSSDTNGEVSTSTVTMGMEVTTTTSEIIFPEDLSEYSLYQNN